MYNLGFIIEQALGHLTHGRNLRQFVSQDPSVEAHWGFPSWEARGWAGRLPGVGGNWTVQAGWQARRQLADMQRQARPQAHFFHTQVTAVLASDWLRRIPSLVSLDATPRQMDGLGEHYQHAAGPAWLERVKARLNRDCFRLARHIVTWSAWAKQGLVDEYGVPAGKVTIIPPGVDTAAWASAPRQPDVNQPLRILFVGADLERKGGRTLVQAFRSLRHTVPACELHVVTRTPLASEPGLEVHTNLPPNSPALRQLFQSSDVFCLPTLGDCLPLALAEAGAAALPLVSTRLAAVPEIVRDGETGFLAPVGDVDVLAAILERLAGDPQLRLALGLGAQQLVRREFDAATNASRILDLLKAMVDDARASSVNS